MSLTSDELQAIRERVNQATPGPWKYDSYYREITGPQIRTTYDMADVVVEKEDAEFIAHAREDVPALLDEIERLQRENEILHKSNGDWFLRCRHMRESIRIAIKDIENHAPKFARGTLLEAIGESDAW